MPSNPRRVLRPHSDMKREVCGDHAFSHGDSKTEALHRDTNYVGVLATALEVYSCMIHERNC